MGMKEEIFSIATALGYDGATPTSKTKAVHAVAEAVESGGAGGGTAGYDVTKVWAVPEQTVTSREITNGTFTTWGANVTVGNLAQMLEDGQTELTLVVDGTAYAATLAQMPAPSGTAIGIMQDGTLGGYAVRLFDETTYVIGPFNDTEPTEHTVSCRYEVVTTTSDFVSAVNKAANPSKIGALEFMGFVTLTTRKDSSVTVGAGETCYLSTDNCEFIDDEVVEKYGEGWESRLKARIADSVHVPDGLLLVGFNANPIFFGVYNPTDTAYVFDNLNKNASISIACFC